MQLQSARRRPSSNGHVLHSLPRARRRRGFLTQPPPTLPLSTARSIDRAPPPINSCHFCRSPRHTINHTYEQFPLLSSSISGNRSIDRRFHQSVRHGGCRGFVSSPSPPVAVLAAGAAAAAAGEQYRVGGPDGWIAPPPEEEELYYSRWASSIAFYVGDSIGNESTAVSSHRRQLVIDLLFFNFAFAFASMACGGRVRVQERLGDQGEQGGVLPLQRDGRRRRRRRPRAGRRRQGVLPLGPRLRLLRQPRPRPLQRGPEAHDQRPRRRAAGSSAGAVDGLRHRSGGGIRVRRGVVLRSRRVGCRDGHGRLGLTL